MKKLFIIVLIAGLTNACSNDDDNKRSGVCYCEFFKGDDQEYDLSSMTKEEQREECNRHDNNAAKFGGSCELE